MSHPIGRIMVEVAQRFQAYYTSNSRRKGRRVDGIDIIIDIARYKTYSYSSSSVNGLLVEDIIKVEGPCQSVLANNI